MLQRNIERKENSEGNNVTCRWKIKEIRAKSQRKKKVKANKKGRNINNQKWIIMGCIYNYCYGCSRQKKNNNLTNILQHHPAVVVSMVIAIRLPIKDSQNNIISIAFYLNNQRHHIIYSTYLIDCYQFRLHPVVSSSINHPLVVVTLYLLPTTHYIKIIQ